MQSYLLPHICNGFLNSEHVHRLGIANDWGNQTLLRRNGDADVDIISENDGVTTIWALDGGIDNWKIPHGKDGSASKGAHESKLNARLLQDVVLVQLAELHERGHVNLVECCQ